MLFLWPGGAYFEHLIIFTRLRSNNIFPHYGIQVGKSLQYRLIDLFFDGDLNPCEVNLTFGHELDSDAHGQTHRS